MKRHRLLSCFSFGAVLLGLVLVPCLRGQATFGNLIGTVTDPAGAVVVGAKITITSAERGTVRSTTTNDSGNYTLNDNASLNADAGLRPDIVPGVDPIEVPGGQNRDLWFSPAAYRVPALYTFGNAGRNSLRGPGAGVGRSGASQGLFPGGEKSHVPLGNVQRV